MTGFVATAAVPNTNLKVSWDPQPDAAMEEDDDPAITSFACIIDGTPRTIISAAWDTPLTLDVLVSGNPPATLGELQYNVTDPFVHTDPGDVLAIAPQVVFET